MVECDLLPPLAGDLGELPPPHPSPKFLCWRLHSSTPSWGPLPTRSTHLVPVLWGPFLGNDGAGGGEGGLCVTPLVGKVSPRTRMGPQRV